MITYAYILHFDICKVDWEKAVIPILLFYYHYNVTFFSCGMCYHIEIVVYIIRLLYWEKVIIIYMINFLLYGGEVMGVNKQILDDQKVAQMINKHIIIGITFNDFDGTFLEQKQIHGNIIRINEKEGIVVKLHDSDIEYSLPPYLDSVEVAPEGEYRFRSTGEVVVNPDYMTSWTITKPDPNETN